MKKAIFSFALILFLSDCRKPLPERILGVWENTKTCGAEGNCRYPNPALGPSKLTVLENGLALYADPELEGPNKGKEFHIEYLLEEENTKSKSPELVFRFLNLGFEIRYVIAKLDEEELELFNPKKENTETYRRVGKK